MKVKIQIAYFFSFIFFVFLFLLNIYAYTQIDNRKNNNNKSYFPNDTLPSNEELLALQFFQNKEFGKAADLYEKVFKKNPTYINYCNFLNCMLESKDYSAAHKLIKKQIKDNPNDFKYLIDIGYLYKQSGDVLKANAEFDKTIKLLNNYNPQQIFDLANAFLYRNEIEYAINVYLKGKKLYKNYPYNFYLADLYEKKQEFSLMMAEYVDLLDFDESYLTEIQNKLQIKIIEQDPDNSKKEALKAVLLSKIQNNSDKIIFSKFLLWYAMQIKDFEIAFIQAKSIDKKLSLQGETLFNLAALATSNANFEIPIKSYEYIISQGQAGYYYFNSRIELLNVYFLKITTTIHYSQQEINNLEKIYLVTIDELGKTATTITILKNLAHLQAFYLNKSKEAIALLNEAVEIKNASPSIIAECKIELADILLFTGDVWEATLLYSQVEKAFKNEPIGFEAKFKNAKLYFYISEFNWAKAQLDVLKASTSKLIANDAMDLSLLISDNIDYDSSTVPLSFYARADLLSFRNKNNEALQLLDSINILFPNHPINDEVLFKKAQINMTLGNFSDADTLLKQVYSFYPNEILADKALFQLAGLYETIFNNKNLSMNYYQMLFINYPSSVLAVEARKKYRILRGDITN